MPTLVALQVAADTEVRLVDLSTTLARKDDYLITAGRDTIAVERPAAFAQRYEILTEGDLLLPAHVRQALEVTLGLGACRSPADLLLAVGRLATIAIGDIRLDFTPGQLEELAHRARKRGKTVADEIKAVVDRVRDEVFWKGPA